MSEARRVRFGILLALAAGGAPLALHATGCGSDVTTGDVGSASGSGGAGGAGGAVSSAASVGSSSTSVSSTGQGGGPPTCANGPPQQECFTLDQLEDIINNPPVGGDEPADAGVMLTECPGPELAVNGCCNAATAGPEMQNDLCCYWFCDNGCCGRPFVIDGRATAAPSVRRSDWLSAELTAEVSDDARDIDPATRASLHEAWLLDATMEHASIASFARFTLELLALGAPPELIADAQRASLDEIEHARLCFALAARFGRAPAGPGPLDVAGGSLRTSLVDAAVAAVMEGCIGETIAAVVAREQLALAQDPGVLRALGRIAADEERHAALAYRFVRWAIGAGGNPVREAVARAFAEGTQAARCAASAASADARDIFEAELRRYGRLGEAEMRAATRAALDEVIAPCAREVMAA